MVSVDSHYCHGYVDGNDSAQLVVYLPHGTQQPQPPLSSYSTASGKTMRLVSSHHWPHSRFPPCMAQTTAKEDPPWHHIVTVLWLYTCQGRTERCVAHRSLQAELGRILIAYTACIGRIRICITMQSHLLAERVPSYCSNHQGNRSGVRGRGYKEAGKNP